MNVALIDEQFKHEIQANILIEVISEIEFEFRFVEKS